MSRGRKSAQSSISSDWKRIFKKSVGYYLQTIIVELGSQKSTENIEDSDKPFKIPNNWNWFKLGELCNYGSSSKAEPKDLNDKTWVLDLEDIEKETSVLLNKVRFEERNSLSTKSVFKKGDVLYSKLRPYLDKVIVADEDGVCTTEILPLTFSDEINPHFLLITLKLKSFLDYVNSVTKGMKMPRLGTKEGKNALIPLPSLSEQNKILSFLNDLENNQLKSDCYFNCEVEKKIVNLHKSQLTGSEISTELSHQLELVRQLRQAFLREAMQGKLVPQDGQDEPAEILLGKIKAEKEKLIAEKKIKKDKPLAEINDEEIPFEIPNNWVWCRLGEICEINGGKRVPAGYQLLTKPTPYIYIRVSDMQNGTIIDTDLHYIEERIYEQIKRYTISKDDIYMTIVGATIGKCGLVPERFHNVNLTENAVKVTPSRVDKNFLYLLLKLPFAQAQFIEKTKKVGVEKMAIFRFKNTVLPLPPLAEQKRIVEKLEKLMKYCDELEANIRESKQNAESLLQVALKEALEPK